MKAPVDSDISEIVRLTDRPIREPVRSVAERLFARIRSDEYSVGARLPAERNLAEEFGVTRNTIRDALDLLEKNDIISRRAGSGSFIVYRPELASNTDSQIPVDLKVTETTSPLELQVVRGIIEPEMVRLAVINMAPRDIEALRAGLTRMESVQTDPEEYARCEEDFYLQIARGSDNPLLVAIYELITTVRRQGHWSAQKQKTLSPNRIREYQRRHRSMFEAIEHRDIESAVEYVKLQLVDEQRVLVREM